MRKTLVRIKIEQIEAILEKAQSQGEYITEIYRLIFPDFDEITDIPAGSVLCTNSTWSKICKLCMQWDRKNEPNCMAGGAWMNYGFSGFDGEHLQEFQIKIEQHLIVRAELQVA